MKILTVFNPCGGAGKTTLAAVLLSTLAQSARRVGALDLDLRRRVLTRFLERRGLWGLPEPVLLSSGRFERATPQSMGAQMKMCLSEARRLDLDLLVVDTTPQSPLPMAHALLESDVLITPLQDNPLEVEDVLGSARAAGLSDLVDRLRAARRDGYPEWIIVRNRLPTLSTRLGQRLEDQARKASETGRFRVTAGLGERVTYREMFETGRTPLDPPAENREPPPSNVMARAEVRELMREFCLAG